ncbi:MAG: hypothetical protein NVS2B14_14420 [Chamaesiphon sp.]
MGQSTVIVTCANPACNKDFGKPRNEFNRSEKLGREHFCSLKCFANLKGLRNFKDKANTNHTYLKRGSEKDHFSPFRYHLKVMIKSAKHRNQECSVKLAELKLLWEEQKGICPYTGWNLVLLNGHGEYKCATFTPNRASVDRKDSSLGYTLENIQFVAAIANFTKNAFTEQDLIEFCYQVNRFRYGENTREALDSLGINNYGNIFKLTAETTRYLGTGTRRDEYSPFRQYHKLARRRVKGRSRECTITVQELKELWEKQGGCCPYTGWELDNPETTNEWDNYKLHPRRASLDRIDSSVGYVPGNVQFVAVMANYGKRDFKEDELLEFCKAVVNYKLRNQ